MKSGTLRVLRAILMMVLLTAWPVPTNQAVAENVVEVPVLAAITANNKGVFEVMLVWWDQKSEPNPIALHWLDGGVTLKPSHLEAMADAFNFAISHTPQTKHTGTVSVQGVAYLPTSTDGPSAGAVMAVGFVAVLKGESIIRGIALTGTIQPDGRIGAVGAIPDKVRAAAREGYRTVLIPQGQLHSSEWNLSSLAMELNITVKEVETVEEAYELMTGRRM
jgi:Lon-like protease